MRLSDLVREQAPEPRKDAAGQLLPGPFSDSKSSCDAQAVPLREVDACADWYGRTQKGMMAIEEAARTNRRIAIDWCHRLAEELVALLAVNDDLILRTMQGDHGAYQIANAIHVAILSVKIGQGLHYDSVALARLALAGLLHDLGMWLVPQEIREKPGSLSADEWAEIHAHPEQGRRVAAEMGESFHWLATAIAQEHERWDGSGYPCRLKGGEIGEVAQIVGLADMLDAMISPRPYRTQIVPHQALRSLLVQHKQAFQPRLLKTLVDQLSLYPVGTVVRLNDGHIGVVSKVNSRFPLRPVLRVQRNHEGLATGDTVPLDLSHETATHIVEVLPAMQAA